MVNASPSNAPRIVKPKGFHHRVLLVGAPGVGKTPLAASFPRPLFFDPEYGAELYRAQFEFAEFDLAGIDSYYEALLASIKLLKVDQQGYQTLVVDSISIVYDRLTESHTNARGELTQQTRTYANYKMKLLYAELVSLPMHIVVTARREEQYGTKNQSLVKEGDKADADKMILHCCHFAFFMQKNKPVEIWKLRGVTNPPATVERLTFNWIDGVARKLLQNANTRLWSVEDIRNELSSMFNADKHLANTVDKLVREGKLPGDLTAIQAVNIVREYVESHHPERAVWHKDTDAVANLDAGLREEFNGLTLEAFYQLTNSAAEDYETAVQVLERAESLEL